MTHAASRKIKGARTVAEAVAIAENCGDKQALVSAARKCAELRDFGSSFKLLNGLLKDCRERGSDYPLVALTTALWILSRVSDSSLRRAGFQLTLAIVNESVAFDSSSQQMDDLALCRAVEAYTPTEGPYTVWGVYTSLLTYLLANGSVVIAADLASKLGTELQPRLSDAENSRKRTSLNALYTTIVKCLLTAKRHDKVLAIYEKINAQFDLDSGFYSCLISGFSSDASLLSVCQSLFADAAAANKLSPAVISALCNAYATNGMHSAIRQVLEDGGDNVSCHLCGIYLKALFAQSCQWQDVEWLIEFMRKHSLQRSTIWYGSIFKLCGDGLDKEPRLKKALAFYKEMVTSDKLKPGGSQLHNLLVVGLIHFRKFPDPKKKKLFVKFIKGEFDKYGSKYSNTLASLL